MPLPGSLVGLIVASGLLATGPDSADFRAPEEPKLPSASVTPKSNAEVLAPRFTFAGLPVPGFASQHAGWLDLAREAEASSDGRPSIGSVGEPKVSLVELENALGHRVSLKGLLALAVVSNTPMLDSQDVHQGMSGFQLNGKERAGKEENQGSDLEAFLQLTDLEKAAKQPLRHRAKKQPSAEPVAVLLLGIPTVAFMFRRRKPYG